MHLRDVVRGGQEGSQARVKVSPIKERSIRDGEEGGLHLHRPPRGGMGGEGVMGDVNEKVTWGEDWLLKEEC